MTTLYGRVNDGGIDLAKSGTARREYFERNGYVARTNQRQQGRSGLIHEIDVLAEKGDVAGVHRVAVECKAWRSPIEKDIIYKLEEVTRDTGLSKGSVVSAGGLRAGARPAADQANIEVWGQDEIRTSSARKPLPRCRLRWVRRLSASLQP